MQIKKDSQPAEEEKHSARVRHLRGWRVQMVRHPRTDLYYAAGFKLAQ